mmetsp:Transcript_16519/g.50593  ORF Transcript_16519/g.50593 Transcript_16519/m.50593 type:complete len:361 (+) Transcript_16519:4526-5608(+)
MQYRGPWARSPLFEDGSWLVAQGGTKQNVIALRRNTDVDLAEHHDCYDAKLLQITSAVTYSGFADAEGSLDETTFCFPAIRIVGHAKAGTSALYYLLTAHSEIMPAASKKEFCVREGDLWALFTGLGTTLDENERRDGSVLTVNGCLFPENAMLEHFVLRAPRSARLYVVRDLPDLMWASYNFWCDGTNELLCEREQWAKQGVHYRSPEHFDAVLQAARFPGTKTFLNAKAPETMSTFYRGSLHFHDALATSGTVLTLANEEMAANVTAVWSKISTYVGKELGVALAPHGGLEEFAGVRVNAGGGEKGAKKVSEAGNFKKGVYPISGNREVLKETVEYIKESWAEDCKYTSERSGWNYCT